MTSSLKHVLQEKFAEDTLSDAQMARLQTTQQQLAAVQKRSSIFGRSRTAILGLVASLILGIALLLNVAQLNKDMPFAIATEVVHNHFKLKPLEVQSEALQEISRYFTKLDFAPVRSTVVDTQNMTLLGARYCSLQGITAAQFRYQKSNGEVVTFYEVPYDAERYQEFPNVDEGEQPMITYVNGIGVKMWVEKGLMMAATL